MLGEFTAEMESGTHDVSQTPWTEVEHACHGIDDAVVEISVALEFLSQVTTGEPRNAVGDGQVALQRIRGLLISLHETCERASSAPVERSATG